MAERGGGVSLEVGLAADAPPTAGSAGGPPPLRGAG